MIRALDEGSGRAVFEEQSLADEEFELSTKEASTFVVDGMLFFNP